MGMGEINGMGMAWYERVTGLLTAQTTRFLCYICIVGI